MRLVKRVSARSYNQPDSEIRLAGRTMGPTLGDAVGPTRSWRGCGPGSRRSRGTRSGTRSGTRGGTSGWCCCRSVGRGRRGSRCRWIAATRCPVDVNVVYCYVAKRLLVILTAFDGLESNPCGRRLYACLLEYPCVFCSKTHILSAKRVLNRTKTHFPISHPNRRCQLYILSGSIPTNLQKNLLKLKTNARPTSDGFVLPRVEFDNQVVQTLVVSLVHKQGTRVLP